ncbi:MAG TPA: LacI family DNA-binding transcriptional regulator [Tepidisphaeraceae bacterium]|jgi:DNA-binding LacI/PurR family transcriptional regulator|nr:LacI family DNA-binding transcriptional regulator [Tepidisphaeraceae bacterium]
MGVTLKDIASQTQLSIRSVSRILNLNEGEMFRPETRDKVLAAAKQLGYRPNTMARGMRSGRRSAIGLLLSTDAQRSVVPFGTLVGLERHLSRQGLQLIVGEVPDEDLSDDTYVPRLLREWSTDGMLIAYTQNIPDRVMSLLQECSVPYVWLNAKVGNDCVFPDDHGAAAAVTEHLLRLGHRKIEYLCHVPNAHYSRGDRRAGYTAVMEAAGLSPVIREQVPAGQTVTGMDLRPLLARSDGRATAYVAGSAIDARAAYVAALRLGLEVPRDLSIVGIVDDGRDLDLGGLQLTAMDWPREALGELAARLIVDKVATPDAVQACQAVPFNFLEGGSAGVPNG